MLATGFRMIKVKMFPTADMITAMVLIMPISWAWVNWILPLIVETRESRLFSIIFIEWYDEFCKNIINHERGV